MSPGFSISLHAWRGIGGDQEPDLFMARFRFGIFTVSIESDDWLPAYRKLRRTIVDALKISDQAQRMRNSDGQ